MKKLKPHKLNTTLQTILEITYALIVVVIYNIISFEITGYTEIDKHYNKYGVVFFYSLIISFAIFLFIAKMIKMYISNKDKIIYYSIRWQPILIISAVLIIVFEFLKN